MNLEDTILAAASAQGIEIPKEEESKTEEVQEESSETDVDDKEIKAHDISEELEEPDFLSGDIKDIKVADPKPDEEPKKEIPVQPEIEEAEEEDSSNPLEFKVALIFAVLFVIFTIVTHYTLIYTGTGGLNVLSFIAGLSDITPFILNLLQGSGVAVVVVTACCMQAIVSNIAVNMCYALFFAGGKSPLRRWVLRGFGGVIAVNVCLLLFFYLL